MAKRQRLDEEEQRPVKGRTSLADDLLRSEDRLRELEPGVRIDKNALDDALIEQPDLYYEVAKQYAQAASIRDRAKYDLEVLEARTDKNIRREATANEEKKAEKQIAAEILMDPDVKEAQYHLLTWASLASRWAALEQSFGQRGYALKELVHLYNSAYWADKVGRVEQGEAKDRRYVQHRRILADERRKRSED